MDTLTRQFERIRNDRRLPAVVLFLLAAAVYANTYGNQFTYDDRAVVLSDHRIRSLHSLASLFTRDYWMLEGTNLYRPVTMLTLALNYALSGESPLSYHLISQLLHGLNTVLLFLFLGNFFRDEGHLRLRFLAAAVFAVHPAATEAVNLVVGRAELLAFAFSLSAFQLFIRRGRGTGYLRGSLLLYVLAMLSKESAMILPLFLLLYHLFFERGTDRSRFRDMAGYGAAFLLIAAVRYAVIGSFGPDESMQYFKGISWTSTALTMAKVMAYYGKIVLWPVGLQVLYGFNDIPVASSLLDPWVLPSIAVLLALAAAAWLLYRRDRTLSFFIVWPFIAFLPVMNVIVPTGALLGIRFLYLPMVGYSVLIASLLTMLPDRAAAALQRERSLQPRRWGDLAAGAVLLFLAVLTVVRNSEWKDSETLFSKELARSPESTLALSVLAQSLPLERAEALALKSLALNPIEPVSLYVMGTLLEKKGDYAGAEQFYRRSLTGHPTAETLQALGRLLSNTGRLAEAEEVFRKAIGLKPYWSPAYEDLAVVLLRKGERDAALSLVQQALRINPGSAAAYNLLGTCYKEAGDAGKAIQAFQRAIAAAPDLLEARYNLADSYEQIDPAMAVRAWQEYVQAAETLDSERPWVAHARGRIEALSRMPGRR